MIVRLTSLTEREDTMLIYWLIGVALVFFIITYGVRYGIDTSKQVKAIKMELREIKKQLKEMNKDTK